MIDLSATTVTRKNLLHPLALGELTWLELWQVQVDASTCYRITSNPQQITMDDERYAPFPIGRAEITEDTEGTVPELSVSVSNIDLAVQEALEAGNIIGLEVVLYIIPVDSGAVGSYSSDDARVYRLKVQDATANESAVVFRLGQVNLFDQAFPKNRFIRSTCGKVYGSTECGYDTTRSGALATCSKRLDGSNGCEAHGDDEVSAGLVRRHPLLFGGYPGILKGPIA